MELNDIIAVNRMYADFYPHLARQVLEAYRRSSGRVSGRALELGPYAPGISVALAAMAPQLEITVADDTPGIREHFQEVLAQAGLEDRIRLEEANVESLPYADETYDLVYFRGALFFTWDPVQLLRESDRVLRPAGVALIGGGFGAGAPDDLIEGIADEARALNRKLGKSVVGYAEAEAFARRAGVWNRSRLDKRHGLWVVIRKDDN